ncbi:YdcF family protein [Agrococcus sp. Marseille-P2731]|uniref:YdcF family protein n=1 Tax=Agrococcus sp. Marseille-P2731 TaxID=1841862 RepID=UPI0009305EDF|nr:YdcF family protein [Agrococcus sp. Marseille-P2731]
MGVRDRIRALRAVLWSACIVVGFTALLTRALRRPVAAWLELPAPQGPWALLAAAALVATLGLGGASLWHALMLRRLVRVRPVDVAIALLGIGMLLLAVAIGVAAGIEPALARAILLLALPLWVAGLAAATLAMAIFLHLRRSRPPATAATVLILGAGLRGREVGPLLRRRVERGAQLWRASLAARPGARIVVAGGQGPDEVRTEASAMADHLVHQLGVPRAAIDLEEASTTTRENLELSRALVTGPGRAPLAVVTSEYHALRTAGLLARAGIAGTVVGAWTRPSYRPGAIVREALAVAAERRWWCLGIALALWALAGWVLLGRP